MMFSDPSNGPKRGSTLGRMRGGAIDNKIRNELLSYAEKAIYVRMYETMIGSLNKLHDSHKYHDWYHGYAAIRMPKPTYIGRCIVPHSWRPHRPAPPAPHKKIL